MRNIEVKRICLFLLLLPLAQITTGCSHTKQTEVKIGNYTVPPVVGWKRQLSHGKLINSVKYSIVEQHADIALTFLVFDTPSGVTPPATVDDLKQMAKMAAKTDVDMKLTTKILTSRPDQYKGLPAYTTETESINGSKKVTARFLDFTDGKNLYRFHLVIKQPISSDAVTKTADQAWAKMLADLK